MGSQGTGDDVHGQEGARLHVAAEDVGDDCGVDQSTAALLGDEQGVPAELG